MCEIFFLLDPLVAWCESLLVPGHLDKKFSGGGGGGIAIIASSSRGPGET